MITTVNQEKITKTTELTAKLNDAKAKAKKSVLLLIERHGEIRFVPVQLLRSRTAALATAQPRLCRLPADDGGGEDGDSAK